MDQFNYGVYVKDRSFHSPSLSGLNYYSIIKHFLVYKYHSEYYGCIFPWGNCLYQRYDPTVQGSFKLVRHIVKGKAHCASIQGAKKWQVTT